MIIIICLILVLACFYCIHFSGVHGYSLFYKNVAKIFNILDSKLTLTIFSL